VRSEGTEESVGPAQCAHGMQAKLGRVGRLAEVSHGKLLYHVSLSEFVAGQRITQVGYASRPHSVFFREPPPRPEEVDDKYWSYRLTEQIFERIRKEIAGHAPSRRTAFFTFLCEHWADEFRTRSRSGGRTYSVQGEADATAIAADMRLRDAAAILARETIAERQARGFPGSPEETIMRLARAYWVGRAARDLGGAMAAPEILIDGDIVVRELALPS
jgi:hypothetical protein